MSPRPLPCSASSPHCSKGFALVIVLAILVMVTIFVVAYAVIMQSERKASKNFQERERAQELAEGMLNRILGEHAAPEIAGTHLKPYASPDYYDESTKLPKSTSPYLVDPTAPGKEIYRRIYGIVPASDISTANHLVMISKPQSGSGVAAYSPQDWTYLGLTDASNTLLPKSEKGDPICPQWIDYYETLSDGKKAAYPSGQVAFAIWEESGKFDINMAGADSGINGLAPHDLGLETQLADAPAFLAKLNGSNGQRDRNNFSLRAIKQSSDPLNKTGDDQWFFSLKELVDRNLATPEQLVNFTVWSRDFDVRPEWDGDRSPANAESFLRSYINNPKLFELFQNDNVGPSLVQDTLDEQQLLNALPTSLRNSAEKNDWLEVMRLLAVIRRALPPFVKTPAVDGSQLSPNSWTDNDVWGIALNILQASATPSDQNLFAFDRKTYPQEPYKDEHTRHGIRVTPYPVEVAIRITKTSSGATTSNSTYDLDEFIKIWNPYNVSMTKPNGDPITYVVGEHLNPHSAGWKPHQTGVWDRTDSRSRVTPVTAPGPGKFQVVKLPTRTVTGADLDKQAFPNTKIPMSAPPDYLKGLWIEHRPFVMDADYYPFNAGSVWSTVNVYSDMIVPSWENVTGDSDKNAMRSYIHNSKMPKNVGDKAWYSWQIDDPRMGGIRQFQPNNDALIQAFFDQPDSNRNSGTCLTSPTPPPYTWKGYLNKHSLPGPGLEDDGFYAGKSFSVGGETVKGYNINFGENFPGGISNQTSFEKAMETFALPCRPLANIGELGTIFAYRPWRVLNFGATVAPLEAGVTASNELGKNPMAFLDYFSTVGTETADRTLNYMVGGGSPGTSATANSNKRKQGMRWLFESVTEDANNDQVPSGNLRPIRGRINLNSANVETLTQLLKAPYRLPSSLGLKARTDLNPTPVASQIGISDLEVTVDPADAGKLAEEVIRIRPLRTLSDLQKLDAGNNSIIKQMHGKYPASVVNAMIGRLAQFGTVRQQIYTIDLLARTFNKEAEKRRLNDATAKRSLTAEVRLRARVYFDTFSRQAFVESIESR